MHQAYARIFLFLLSLENQQRGNGPPTSPFCRESWLDTRLPLSVWKKGPGTSDVVVVGADAVRVHGLWG